MTICGEFRGSASPPCVINFFTAVVAPQLVANMSHFFALRWYHVVRKKPWGPCAQTIEPERTLKLTNTHTHISRPVLLSSFCQYVILLRWSSKYNERKIRCRTIWCGLRGGCQALSDRISASDASLAIGHGRRTPCCYTAPAHAVTEEAKSTQNYSKKPLHWIQHLRASTHARARAHTHTRSIG